MQRIFQSLTGRLIVLMVIFIMFAEMLIFLPSVTKHRFDYLQERVSAASIATYALRYNQLRFGKDTPVPMRYSSPIEGFDIVPSATYIADMQAIIRTANVEAIVIEELGRKKRLLPLGIDVNEGEILDLREQTGFWKHIGFLYETVHSFFETEHTNNLTLVSDLDGNSDIRVTIKGYQVTEAMLSYGKNIFFLSLIISLITSILIYRFLNRLIVKPIKSIIESMSAFAKSPETVQPLSTSNHRYKIKEIVDAEQGLSMMQAEIQTALQQKSRLAALGEAVSKINHDLRNILASASLIADRISMIDDPRVRNMVPKLIRSMDRAITLCQNTLAFGKLHEPPPRLRIFHLRPLMQEIADTATDSPHIHFEITASNTLQIKADPDQIFRILQNLTRNAVQALEDKTDAAAIHLSAEQTETTTIITVKDNGPGLPNAVLKRLYKPFQNSSAGSAGLGLAITQELVQAHHGKIVLTETNSKGTIFEIHLPIQEH